MKFPPTTPSQERREFKNSLRVIAWQIEHLLRSGIETAGTRIHARLRYFYFVLSTIV